MKKVKVLAVALALTVAMAIPSFAAWETFGTHLPSYQQDVEPSIITRANNASEKPYFTITLYSLSEGFTSAHAWTESQTAGVNFSNPYTEVSVGQTKNIYYSRTVDRGANVKLNLDNPVYTAAAPYASGRWTPN
ncbi:MAG: hypothetical protein Q3X23_02665 [Evtepia sp.]|jgi:hypothetical protein|nr:hypothetical protein [Evtepia sp.]